MVDLNTFDVNPNATKSLSVLRLSGTVPVRLFLFNRMYCNRDRVDRVSGMVVLRLLEARERKLREMGNALTDEKSVNKL